MVVSQSPRRNRCSIDTTIGVGDPAGANVTFDGSVTGGGDLSIDAGTGGLVVFNGADAAGQVTLGTLTLTNADSFAIAGNLTLGDLVTTVMDTPSR